jgi:alpha-glucosidase
MKQILLLSIFLITGALLHAQSRNLSVKSPDGKITVDVSLSDRIYYSVKHGDDVLLAPSGIALVLPGNQSFGVNPVLRSSKQQSYDKTILPPVYKRSSIRDQYTEMVLSFRGDYQVIFRAYNDGVAYRFVSTGMKDFVILKEQADFTFPGDFKSYLPYVNKEDGASFDDQLWNSFENTYTYVALSEASSRRLAFLPVLVEGPNGKKVCITEADLEDYPGMYLLNADGGKSLSAYHAAYPKRTEQGGHNQLQDIVREREDFIAKAKGKQVFPWRVLAISTDDKQLSDSDLVYKLASPSRLKDVSWIKPGKVAWDWWNDWNLSGVDFKTGVNTQTYKFYIDFAAKEKIEYVILDEGWAVNRKADLMQIVPEIDLKEIISYARSKGVDVILWAGYLAFERDLENVCRHYAAMGVKGFKVDFMDRDDQVMVNFYYRAAETAARYKLLLDFHGAYKPTGLHRTWPNVINFEGVHGLETMKWIPPSVDQVTYDVTIPFVRMVAGPLDYTQGAMRNATKQNYRPVYSEPMSQGTRCRQLSQYIIFDSPLNMLCDAPTAYMKEPELTSFIAAVPTTWDNTVAIAGKVGEFIIMARKKGDDWYLGAMTNWDARTLEAGLSFLGEGNYKALIYRDGVNAHRVAQDYLYEEIPVNSGTRIEIPMAPGGGFIARIIRVQ